MAGGGEDRAGRRFLRTGRRGHRRHRAGVPGSGLAVGRDNTMMHDSIANGRAVGDRVRARDTGDRTGVFAETGSDSWTYDAGFMLLGGGYLLCWAGWLEYARRRRRARRPTVAG